MKLIACMPVRNEAWVLRASIPAVMSWCDEAVVLDHASTDDTPCILGWLAIRFPGRVTILRESGSVWHEAAYRQRLLDEAGRRGATHVAVIDADEIVTANTNCLRKEIEAIGADVLRVPWLQLWGSLDTYRGCDKSVWSDATAPLAFSVEGNGYDVGEFDIHCRTPRRSSRTIGTWGGVMHLQHASRRRLLAKQVLYKITERLRWNTPAGEIECRYGPATDESNLNLLPVPQGWWSGIDRAAIDFNAEPWQEAEVKRLLAEHGREKFADLNLLGF